MKNILVYRIGSIGDNLVALPAFRAIRTLFPDARISYLTNGETEDTEKLIGRKILPENLFDEWIAYPSTSFKNTKKLVLNLRRKKIDALFYLMTRNRSYMRIRRDLLFFRLAGIKKIYGAKYLQQNILTMTPEKPVKTVETELEYLLKCIFYEGLASKSQSSFAPDLNLTSDERKKAETWLEEKFGNDWKKKHLIAVMAASNWESKIWAEENFVKTVSRLIEKKNVFPIIFGGGKEREQGERFLEIWKRGGNAAGELGLRIDAALLENCRLYLGTDTGTMHIAGSVGIPCVAVFAATDYVGRWTPFGENHKIFRERVECEGCFSPKCFNNHKCLNLISVDAVYQACLEILENVSASKT